MTSPSDQPITIYQLKITLDHTAAPIWRQVQVPDCPLPVLHHVIQACMGWEDDHLHCFEAAGRRYPDDQDDGWYGEETASATLGQLVEQGCRSFSYLYDFGDDWRHTIKVEKTLPAETDVHYPHCLGGQGACPPEDCGGVYGYARLLEILRDPDSDEHEETLEWLGEDFDPEHFDADELNEFWTDWNMADIEAYYEAASDGEDEEADDDWDDEEQDWEEDGEDEEEGWDDEEGDAVEDFGDEPFEKPAPIVRQSRTGRNDPCPCGSGKKFKRCCMKKEQPGSLFD